MKQKLILFLAIMVLSFLITGAVFPGIATAQAVSAQGTETLITTGTSDSAQTVPAIAGTRIVWRDGRNEDPEIYMYDISTGTETRITATSSDIDKDQPAINQSGTGVVWQDDRNRLYDIFLYDTVMGTERQITTDGPNHQHPQISGTRIVWDDNRFGNFDIYMFDTSTGTKPRSLTI
jgi:beta propeller repeat protein